MSTAATAAPAPPAAATAVDHIQFIVEALRQPPFSQTALTMVALNSKSPQELLQLLNDVLSEIDPRQRRDLRDEAPEATAVRMIDTLLVLNYKHGQELTQFRDGLLAAAPSVVHPLLAWLLQRVPELKKRAYVARFLRQLDVPEDCFADEAVLGQYQAYRELQNEFKEVHREVERLRSSKSDPVELEREIQQLENEREQLSNKMVKLRHKVENDSQYAQMSFDELLAATQALRREQEEEGQLADALEKQRQEFFAAEQRHRQANKRLRQLQASMAGGNVEDMLVRLRREVKDYAALATSRLPAEIAAREQALAELQAAASTKPLSDAELAQLEAEIGELEASVGALTAERDKAQAAVDSKIGFYRDRATAVEKKHDRLLEECRERQAEVDEASEALRRVERELEGFMVNGQKPKTEAQMKEYTKELKAKAEKYMALKAELQALWSEVAVLDRTQQTLRTRDDNLQEITRELEEAKGVQGAVAAQDALEQVSASKSEVDADKGAALDELSHVVESISRKIKEKKGKLTPQIAKLHEVRTQYKDVETEYSTRKKSIAGAVAGAEAERVKIEQELKVNRDALNSEESNYHLLSSLRCMNEARAMLAEQERKFQLGQGRLSNQFRTFQEHLEAAIRQQEESAKEFRKQQRKVQDSHAQHVQQRSKFKALSSLLQLKAQSLQRRAQQEQEQRREAEAQLAAGFGVGAAPSLVDAVGGGDGGAAQTMSFE